MLYRPATLRCPVCSAPHCACGNGETRYPPFDIIPTIKEVAAVGELRRYDVTLNGVTTTMLLNEVDAKAYGAAARPTAGGEPKSASKAKPVPNKARPAASIDSD
jgi:hypothetical protein